MKTALLDWLDRLPHVAVLPRWRANWWTGQQSFHYGTQTYRHFYHGHNCGWPTGRMTERAVELALADAWLARTDGDVIEIGAVTPYYWPGRVKCVADPVDAHAAVTARTSVFDVDLHGRDVLSISTLEHIGLGDYGLPSDSSGPRRAFEKIARESRWYLLTVPFGYNPYADSVFFADEGPPAHYFAREARGNAWTEVSSAAAARRPYGDPPLNSEGGWANGLAVLERGDLL